jgi:hypothetical protein
MVKLTRTEIRIIDDAFDMHGGYVLNFSDRTMAEFFEDELRLDLEQAKYRYNGSSKARRLRAFISVEDAFIVTKVLRTLWKHRQTIPIYAESEETQGIQTRLFDLIGKIEGGGGVPNTDALHQFTRDQTLEELIGSIERDIAANKPASALDRLHTYCMKKFSHLLEQHGLLCEKSEPLHSRVGRYVKALEQQRSLTQTTRRIVKVSIGIFDDFNTIRNNESLAHDNAILNQAEARFVFDGVSAILRFFKSIEADQFESHVIAPSRD